MALMGIPFQPLFAKRAASGDVEPSSPLASPSINMLALCATSEDEATEELMASADDDVDGNEEVVLVTHHQRHLIIAKTRTTTAAEAPNPMPKYFSQSNSDFFDCRWTSLSEI